MKPSKQIWEWMVAAAPLIAAVALAGILMSGKLGRLDGWAGILLFFAIAGGVLVGLIGGVVLAIAARNPLWLIAAVASSCLGYLGLVFTTGMALGNMH